MNYFSLLDLSVSPRQDDAVLRKRYFDAQRQCHPDRATSDRQRLEFLQKSADVNAAYKTISSVESRLYYILSLHGYDVDSDKTIHAPALLMESMELREELSELQNVDKISEFLVIISRKINEVIALCSDAIERKDWDEAVELALRLRYLCKVSQEATVKRQTMKG